MAVGDNIHKLRKQHNMTLEELSKFIGITRQTLCRYESGQIQVPSDKVEMLAKVFNVSPAEIMGWEGTSDTAPLPHAQYREILSEGGIRLLLDEDANVPDEKIEDIIKYIKLRQGQVGK